MRWSPLALLVLLALGAGAVAEPDVVTVHLAWEPGNLGGASSGRIPFKPEPPEGVQPLPDLREGRYARIRMAGSPKGLLVAIDADPANPRLWVDHNFDGDLRDEKQSSLALSGTTRYRLQVVLAPYEDESVPVPVPLYFMHVPANGADYYSVYARIHRLGNVVLGGRLRPVALTDHSFDAAFDDAERDRIYVDLDGNGRIDALGEASERVLPGEPFRVGDEGWTAHVVSRSGHAVEFRRAQSVPPARSRGWEDTTAPAAGVLRSKPDVPWKELIERYEAERKQTYAERTATIQLIGDCGTDESLAFLLDVVAGDGDRNVQAAGLRALGNSAYLESGGKRILALAKKATSSEAYALAQTLHQMGHPDRESAYLQMIASADANAVSGAARYLAYMESATGRERILHIVAEHGTPTVRHIAYINGARSLKGGPPVELILKAADDDYEALQAEAIRDLGKLGHPEARKRALALASVRPVPINVGLALAEVLGSAGDGKAVTALLGFLEDERLHANVKKLVLEQLRSLRAPDAVDSIVAALQSDAPAVRATAAEVLASIVEVDVTKALLARAKKEKDEEVLALLLEALGDHGDVAALPTLLKQAKSRAKPGARASAVRALARLGFHHPKVRDFLLSLLGGRDMESRILALDAAGASGDESLLPKILPNLDHEDWQVRLAAVEAIDHLRPRAAIAPLIARLGPEEEDRVRDAIASTLFRLTAMNLYDDHDIWKRWWAENEHAFRVPTDIPTLPEDHAGGTQAGFYGIPIKSDRIVFVIDQSGSMSAPGAIVQDENDEESRLNRLDVAVREVLGAVAKLKNRARVNVILFHTVIDPWKPILQPLNASNRSALQRHLESKVPTGGTNIYDALELALQMKDVDTIFLLSDGVPGAGKYVATPDILRAVRRENQTRRIAIHGVSIGMDSELLRLLARENGGRYARR
ncbi:MAG: HEAT repeat domain-containing protein [Planctomycetota bacterium]|nr:HEAT repeat domain-containing protein [Planctomycetota bacterium]